MSFYRRELRFEDKTGVHCASFVRNFTSKHDKTLKKGILVYIGATFGRAAECSVETEGSRGRGEPVDKWVM